MDIRSRRPAENAPACPTPRRLVNLILCRAATIGSNAINSTGFVIDVCQNRKMKNETATSSSRDIDTRDGILL